MSKSLVLGVVLFIVGVAVGRASALMGGSTPTSIATPVAPSPSPSTAPPAGPPQGGTLRGTVAEVLQVPQYTYLRLESGEWVAVESNLARKVGDTVTVQLQTQMENFTSTSLNRTFPRLWLGTEGGSPAAAPPPAAAMPPPAPAVQGALAAVESSGPAVPMRVVDIFTERQALGGRKVRVTATVDRVNFVQGVYYVHLKDGTGAAAEKTDDLLAISRAEMVAGKSATVEGVVALDKNVGMGTNPVVLDDARPVN